MSSFNQVVNIRSNGTKRVQIAFDQVDESTGELLYPSLTKQAFKAEADVNNILARYRQTGVVEHLSVYQQLYGDFSEVDDYHTALNKLLAADDKFMSLPANIRKKFENDPGKFLEYVEDPANFDEMVVMGLIDSSDLPKKADEISDVGEVT